MSSSANTAPSPTTQPPADPPTDQAPDPTIADLEPRPVWRHFAALNAVPRASKREERVRGFVRRFGESLGLDTREDAVGNVIIRKPATAGREGRPTVLLQGHVDMVHQKNADTDFDFDREGIRMRLEGDWVDAEGTTLGADNGIGVAMIMAVLADGGSVEHPPLEALFTVDEETGMTGAKGLEAGVLQARFMLNLDTEDDRELTIGCAGGIDVTARGTYLPTLARPGAAGLRLTVSGLSGGHSGMDIHRGLGNANKILCRLLLALEDAGVQLAEVDGGGLRNAIPREAKALVAVGDGAHVREQVALARAALEAEYAATDPGLRVTVADAEAPTHVLPDDDRARLLRAVQACPNGIHRMSPEVEGLVQTSNNLARWRVADGEWEVLCLTRSSVDSEKLDEATSVRAAFELVGGEVSYAGDYPGWAPRADSELLRTMRAVYERRFGEAPLVEACHAGLECGLVGAKYPGMEMISFGPNIRGAHSPDERVQVSSVARVWGYLVEVLGVL